jgi:hypothetical protein
MNRPRTRRMFLIVSALGVFLFSPALLRSQASADPLAASIETARRTRDEPQLQSLKTQLEQRVSQNPNEAQSQYDLALVHSYLIDVYESRQDKKAASVAVDKAIEAAQRSIQLNDKSADAHSLLGDLYGRKISLSNPMFAGPKFGPKADEEDKRAVALDDKNPHVWAVLGRKYLMTPGMFWRRRAQSHRKLPEVAFPRSLPRRNLGLAGQGLPEARRQAEGPRRHPARPPTQSGKPIREEYFNVT